MAAAKFVIQNMIATAFGVLLLCSAAIPGAAQPPKETQLGPSSQSKAPTTPSEIEAAKPNPHAPGFRIPLPDLDKMEPAQRADFERESKSFFTPVGPRVPLELSPDVESAWGVLAGAVQKSALPADLYQLTILIVSREWRSQFEWWIHGPVAIAAGVPADVVEAIRVGRMPKFASPGEEATYRYLVELLRSHKVSDATYERLRAIIGTRQLVEMTVLAGHYTNVAMTINAHNVPLRSDVKPPLPELAKNFPAP